ncbi:hypothetical protein EVAR_3306_1 [Eumeta japonica]|uniref:Mariner Mos1 transposase n=1 Tax=Eumeta variegata TaxID=151549 RepID=A0A4C1SVZ4_EUMVA|nr:hypothetical protein EVAR_3306_1 [Eumeta japonica]
MLFLLPLDDLDHAPWTSGDQDRQRGEFRLADGHIPFGLRMNEHQLRLLRHFVCCCRIHKRLQMQGTALHEALVKVNGQRFASPEEAVEEYEKHVSEVTKEEYFQDWFIRMKKSINDNGEYFEKQEIHF